MKRLPIVVALTLSALLAPTFSFACSWIGGPPSIEYHVNNFDESFAHNEAIFIGEVIAVDDDGASIRIDEVFKGQEHLDEIFRYPPGTSCDYAFTQPGPKGLFFMGIYSDGVYIDVGKGLVPPESEHYEVLVKRLRGPGYAYGAITVADSTLDGLAVGASVRQMRDVFGEPLPPPPTKGQMIDDVGGGVYRYDGMSFFSIDHQTLTTYHVTNKEHRLSGGLGVGSRKEDITAQFGQPIQSAVYDDDEVLSYQVRNEDGRLLRFYLDFTLTDNIVTSVHKDLR
ncbi:MAG: hypothetical protein AAF351_15630 [Pseudomonadota bacterium]